MIDPILSYNADEILASLDAARKSVGQMRSATSNGETRLFLNRAKHETERALTWLNGTAEDLSAISTATPGTFTVNVRAVVSGTLDKPGEDVDFDSKWLLYDSSDEDGLVTLRLDTSVVQNAPNADEAVSLALLAAPPLNIVGMHEASVKLWVDNDIDVVLVGEGVAKF